MKIIVAGAGIVGVSTAIWLQRDGHEVTLVDRAGPGEGTSHGNGGVLAAVSLIPVTVPGLMRKAPGMLFDPNQPLFLRWPYLPKLLPFLRRYLSHATADHVRHYARNMAHLLADTLDQHRALAKGTPAERYVIAEDYCYGYTRRADFDGDATGWAIRKDEGIRYTVMDGRDYDDPLFDGQFETVVACHNHGRISDPGAYVKALAAHFEGQGGHVLRRQITDVEMQGDTCTALRTDQGEMRADRIVLCLGPWSGDIARKLGLKDLSFETERGYHIELVNPSAQPKRAIMIAAGKFVITPMEGRIRAAGIVEFGGLQAGPSRAPFDLLRRQVAALLPSVTSERIEEWMGHRPAPADSLPLIGATDGAQKTFVAFGHQHVGLTGGAKTGRIIAQIIGKQPTNVDMGAFDPKRYA